MCWKTLQKTTIARDDIYKRSTLQGYAQLIFNPSGFTSRETSNIINKRIVQQATYFC